METDSAIRSTRSLFPEAPVRPPQWLSILAWMELVSGALGLVTYLSVTLTYPTLYSTWHHLLAVPFFGANIIAGIMLIQKREMGVSLSFIVQLLQVVFWNSGIAWVARAGLHITPVLASTGFGIFFGPAAEFFSYPVETTSVAPGPGLSVLLNLGFFVKPISDASFACGVNLVALAFTRRLWRQLSAQSLATRNPAPADHPVARWSLPAAVAVVAFVELFMLFNGPKSINRPMARWPVITGDTLDIVWSGVWYEAA